MKRQLRMRISVPHLHEAQAQEKLAREMSKLSAAAMEEETLEDEMGADQSSYRYQGNWRKGPVYSGSNHLMIEAEAPEKGLSWQLKHCVRYIKETGIKNQAAKISGEKLNAEVYLPWRIN